MTIYLDIYSSLILASNEEVPIFDGKSIPKNRLNFRFDHKYITDTGVALTGGQVTYQLTELIKADPLGIGGTVDVGDFVSAGLVELTFIGNE